MKENNKEQQSNPKENNKETPGNTENTDPAIQAKTLVKNAHAVGNGTTGKHDGEHSAFRKEDGTTHLEGGDQY